MHRRITKLSLSVLLAFGLSLIIVSFGASENKTQKTIKWYKIDKGLSLAKKEGKHAVLMFYTDWCGYCARMNKETFGNKRVIEKLAKDFIAVKVNAESMDRVTYADKELSESELARVFRVFGYPQTFFVEPDNEIIGRVPGFIKTEEFLRLANYVSGDFNDKMEYDQYVKEIVGSSKK